MANACKCGIWSTQSLIIRSKVLLLSKHGQIFMTQLFINGPFQKNSNMPSRLLKLQAPPSETIVPQVFIDISTLIWKYDIYMRISMCIYGPWASILQRTNHSIPDHTMAVGPGSHEKNTFFFSMLEFNSTHSFERITQIILRFTLYIYIYTYVCIYIYHMCIYYIYVYTYQFIYLIYLYLCHLSVNI